MTKEIRQIDDKFYYFIEGEMSHEGYDDKVECEDFMNDEYEFVMNEKHDYKCDFCNEWFDKDQIQFRIEDRSFTAPYGSTFVINDHIGIIAVCPICKDDIEEC